MSDYGRKSTLHSAHGLSVGETIRIPPADLGSFHRVVSVGPDAFTFTVESVPPPGVVRRVWWRAAGALRTAWFYVSFWCWYRWRSDDEPECTCRAWRAVEDRLESMPGGGALADRLAEARVLYGTGCERCTPQGVLYAGGAGRQ